MSKQRNMILYSTVLKIKNKMQYFTAKIDFINTRR